jgi:eukaryotic-like serine/threonine-protein kinase
VLRYLGSAWTFSSHDRGGARNRRLPSWAFCYDDIVMSSIPPPAAAGALVAGKYRVESMLGQGAFGVVVCAKHIELDETVAIKVLRPKSAKKADIVERFLREARAAVRLKSEHVVRVLDVGKVDSGEPYLVMEHLTGTDLEAVLAEQKQLTIPDAVGLLLQACLGLAEAHSIGLVHRDLKPSNLFVTTRPDGTPLLKVLDFGIAKFSQDPAAKKLTSDDVSMGSPLYMAPEQLESAGDVDARADVWSLGILLFELLSGKPPFDAPSVNGVIAAVLTAPPPRLRDVLPTAPPELESVLLRCMERDPDRRIGSVAELARALAPFARAEDRNAVVRVERTLVAGTARRASFASLPEGVASEGSSRTASDSPRATQHTAAVPRATSDEIEAAGLSKPTSARKLAIAAMALAALAVLGFVATRSSSPTAPAQPNVATETPLAISAEPAAREAIPPPPPEPEVVARVADPPDEAPVAKAPTPTRAPESPRKSSPAAATVSKPQPEKAAGGAAPSRPKPKKDDDLRHLIDGRR